MLHLGNSLVLLHKSPRVSSVTLRCWPACMSKPTSPTYCTTNCRSYETLRHHWFELHAEGHSKAARIAAYLARSGECLAGKAQWIAGPFGHIHRRCNSGVPDAEGAVRAAIAADLRAGGKPDGTGRSGLASAGLQHVVASPERPERRHRPSPKRGGLASADHQHRDQGRWWGRVVAQKHGAFKPRQWRKVHLGMDADTVEIRAIEITDSSVKDGLLPVSWTRG